MFKRNSNSLISNLIGNESSPSIKPFITQAIFSKKKSKGPNKDVFCITDDEVKICVPTIIDATLDVLGNVEVGTSSSPKNLTVWGNTQTKNIKVSGSADFDQDISSKKKIKGDSLEIANNSELKGNVNVGSLVSPKDLTVSGKLKAKTIEVEEGFDFDFSSGITTEGAIKGNSLEIANNSELKGNVNVGSLVSPKDLTVSGKLKAKTIEVEEGFDFDFSSGITTEGIIKGGFLEIENDSNLAGNVNIGTSSSLKDLNVSGNTRTASLQVIGSTSLASNASVAGSLSSQTLKVLGVSSLDGETNVFGNLNAYSNLNVSENTSLQSLQVTGNSVFTEKANFESIEVLSETNVNNLRANTVQIFGETNATNINTLSLNNQNSIDTRTLKVNESPLLKC